MSPLRVLAGAGVLLTTLAGAPGAAPQQSAQAPAGQQPAQAPDNPAGDADQPAAQDPDQPPVFRTGINFVRVDVIVTDSSGNPVMDLQPADFEIVEDDKPQTIETFQLIELNGGRIQGPEGPPRPIRDEYVQEIEAARDDVRLFAIFLDDYHVRWENGMRAREDLARFVELQLGPSDMIGLMYPLEPAAGVVFTRNHAAVARALRRFEGRKFNYEAKNSIEANYVHQLPTEIVERIRNDVSLSALEALMFRMGSVKQGRKALIVLTEGYTNMVPPQLRSPVAGMTGFDNPAANDPTAGQTSLIEQRAMAHASFDMSIALRELTGVANRNNVAIYGVDPRGLADGEFDISQNINAQLSRDYLELTLETIRVMSHDTTGRPIVNRNDLTLGMQQIVRDSSAYYLLGYSSTVSEPDGKFHEIRVRTKRPGLQVRARAGYWALKPEEAERLNQPQPTPGPPPAITDALAVIEQPSRGRVVRTWVGTERTEAGASRVTFIWEPIAPATPASRSARQVAPAHVMVTAAGADGTPYFRGQVPGSNPRVSFEAKPGEVELLLSVRGSDGEVLDSETREITIPDLTGVDATFGTPRLFRARTARALQDLRVGPEPVPAMDREFDRNERLLIRVAAYGPGGAGPTVTARLLNRAGGAMGDLQVDAGSAGDAEMEVPLAGLAPGDYLVELVAAAQGSSATELVGFRVR